MKCPFCRHEDTQVVETRASDDGDSIRRRRRCIACDRRFTTYERPDLQMPFVVKRNGNRSEYSPEKLRASLMLALRKRQVNTEDVEKAANHIEETLLTSGEREVASSHIGELVMEELKKLDLVAYVRFASVYKSFEDIDAFTAIIKDMQARNRKRPPKA